MIALLFFTLAILASPFKSNRHLEAENAALRQQLAVLRRQVRGRVRLTNNDRLFFVQIYRWFPSVLNLITVIRRAGFGRYWRWKSRSLGGRPQIEADLRALIRRMNIENPLWGRHAFMANCLSSALKLHSRRWPDTCSSGMDHQARDGAPSCVTTDI